MKNWKFFSLQLFLWKYFSVFYFSWNHTDRKVRFGSVFSAFTVFWSSRHGDCCNRRAKVGISRKNFVIFRKLINWRQPVCDTYWVNLSQWPHTRGGMRKKFLKGKAEFSSMHVPFTGWLFGRTPPPTVPARTTIRHWYNVLPPSMFSILFVVNLNSRLIELKALTIRNLTCNAWLEEFFIF